MRSVHHTAYPASGVTVGTRGTPSSTMASALGVTAGAVERRAWRDWVDRQRRTHPRPLSASEEWRLVRGYGHVRHMRAAMLTGRDTDPRVVAHIAATADGRDWLRGMLGQGMQRADGLGLDAWRHWRRGLASTPRPVRRPGSVAAAPGVIRVTRPNERGGHAALLAPRRR